MSKINEEIKRMKQLVGYPIITEEMEISSDFEKDVFSVTQNQKHVNLEVGIDPNNDELHRLNLVLMFTKTRGFNELVFYFSMI